MGCAMSEYFHLTIEIEAPITEGDRVDSLIAEVRERARKSGLKVVSIEKETRADVSAESGGKHVG
jgi:hypothetical protein